MNRHHARLAAACGAVLSLSGCRCGGPERAVEALPAAVVTLDKPAVLATIPDGAPATEREFFFSERGGGVAWVEGLGDGFQVVHNGRAGKKYAAVGELALGPDGRRCAHGAQVGDAWRMVVDGTEGRDFTEVQSPVFSPDGRHLAFLAKAGERWHVVVDGALSDGGKSQPLAREFSGDSARIAFIDEADDRGFGRLVVSDLAFKTPVVVDGMASELAVDADRTRGAVASASGGAGQAQVVSFALARPAESRRGPKFEALSRLAFGPGGRSLAYLGERGGQTYLVLDDKEEALAPGQYFGPPVVRPDGKAAAIFVLSVNDVVFHQAFVTGGAGEVAPGGGEGLVYSSTTSSSAARRDPPSIGW
jgi:hypothetical protein